MSSEFLTTSKRDVVEKYITDREINNIKFIDFVNGKFINRDSKLILECSIHGQWDSTSFRSFISKGCMCPYCSGVGKYTKNIAEKHINKKISDTESTLTFIGFFEWSDIKPKNNKCIFLCPNGHIWKSCRLTDFLNKLDGKSCAICSGGADLIPDNAEIEINDIINKNNMNIKFLRFDSWNGCNTKVLFNCPKHGNWNTTTIAAFKKQHSGCPKCSSNGYQTVKSGFLYLQKLTLDNGENFLKFGITNRKVSVRMNEQQRKSQCVHQVLNTWYFEDGNIPFLIEQEIKNRIHCGVLSSEVLPSGFTETTSYENHQIILEIIELYLKKE